jgi:hypothetical protein
MLGLTMEESSVSPETGIAGQLMALVTLIKSWD